LLNEAISDQSFRLHCIWHNALWAQPQCINIMLRNVALAVVTIQQISYHMSTLATCALDHYISLFMTLSGKLHSWSCH